MSERIHEIKVEHKQAGQPRPYADSNYEACITFPVRVDERTAKCIARDFVHSFEEPPTDWAAGSLKYIRPADSDPLDKWKRSTKWNVLITTAFTD